jgi:hypothetical protein
MDATVRVVCGQHADQPDIEELSHQRVLEHRVADQRPARQGIGHEPNHTQVAKLAAVANLSEVND